MTDDITTRTFTFTAEGMYWPPARSRWRRFWDWLLRRPIPQPVQPPGTVPLVYDVRDGDRLVRFFIPAARIEEIE